MADYRRLNIIFSIGEGAILVQQGAHCTRKDLQNSVPSIKQLSYNHAHNDWMALVMEAFSLPFIPMGTIEVESVYTSDLSVQLSRFKKLTSISS